jgi:hypothetical protein
MKAVFAYNYNVHPSSKSNPDIGGPKSAFRPYSVNQPNPPEATSPIICESKSRRKDAFRKIKTMFGLT